MILENIKLKNFRNHKESEIQPCRDINILFGLNGQGKTNFLEAITFISFTKSFFSVNDCDVVKQDASFFEIDANIKEDDEIKTNARIYFDKKNRKKLYTINNAPTKKHSSILGRFPAVMLFPEHQKIANGAPQDRRKFVDTVLSQTSPIYLESLSKYKKALQQRNALLSDKTKKINEEMLFPWTEQLVEHGKEIIFERNKFLNDFLEDIILSYKNISEKKDEPKIKYKPSIETYSADTKQNIEAKLKESYKKNFLLEQRNRSTIVGPHRDDIELSLNDFPVQDFASHGEQKSFLVALKHAEFGFLKKKNRETPILILDDLFSDLDKNRAKKVIDIFSNLGQIFISSTNELSDALSSLNKEVKKFLVHDGAMEEHFIYA